MNLDFQLRKTPSIARQLMFANKMMKLNMDPQIVELANQEVMSKEMITDRLPYTLKPMVQDLEVELCQYAHDHDYRFVMGVRQHQIGLELALLLALNSGLPTIFFAPYSAIENQKWETLLSQHAIPFTKVLPHTTDLSSPILLVDDSTINQVMNERHRLLINVNSPRESLSSISLHRLFGNEKTTAVVPSLVNEFEKIITIFLNDPSINANFTTSSRWGRVPGVQWWDDYFITTSIQEFYPKLQLTKIFSSHQHITQELQNTGFTDISKENLAKMLGIFTSYISN